MQAMRDFYSLKRIFERFLRGDLLEALYRSQGRKIVQGWFRQNKDHLGEMRREEAMEVQPITSTPAIARSRWSIAISTQDLSPETRKMILAFFIELGVRVVEVKKSLADACYEGQDRLARGKERASKAVCEYLESFPGEVDAVALPRVEGLEQIWARFSTEMGEISDALKSRIARLPKVIQLPTEPLAPSFRKTLTKIGLIFTDDLGKIRRALGKANVVSAET